MTDPVNQITDSLKYKYGDKVKRDVKYLITHYTDMRPKSGSHVMKSGGRKENLLYLKGTIPIVYKNHTYNIPIEVWIPDNYPHSPPLCYVRPTANMEIKTTTYVATDGKIILPYLKEWKHHSSDLMGTVEVLQSVFGDDCPVFTKVNVPNLIPNQHLANHQQHQQQQGLPYPLYPHPGTSLPYPKIASPFPATPYPVSGYPMANPALATYNADNNQRYGGRNSNNSNTSNYRNEEEDPSYPNYSSPIAEEAIKESLVSAVGDKIKFRLRDTFTQAQVEMDNLLKTEQRLKDGSVVIDNILRVLEQENDEAESTRKQLDEGIKEANKTVSKFSEEEAGGGQKFDLDDAVTATIPVYKQILSSYAEENAIIDATYYLGEALKKGAIDLDLFLKNIREISRKQFTLKALMQKCRHRAGLPV